MIKVADIQWLAGLLEGEGCFLTSSNTTPVIVLCMTDKDVVERAAALLKVKCYAPTPPAWKIGIRKPIYRIMIHGYKAAQWMMLLYSLMGERRRSKIKQCLAIWRKAPLHPSMRRECPNGHAYTPENTGYSKGKRGGRQCRTCHREGELRRYYRKKALASQIVDTGSR